MKLFATEENVAKQEEEEEEKEEGEKEEESEIELRVRDFFFLICFHSGCPELKVMRRTVTNPYFTHEC